MKKKKSIFTRITQIFVWLMIIVTIAGVVFGAMMSFM
ncbi:MAG: DUF4044 domain-containing protein [Bombilactobacillus mellifer]|nr:DUF4044 domain-containing protein [Bombilactobacillus mellifer]MBH9990601.1 DUF4044 domain-containing protein [Lactobacillus sp. W8092]MCT6825587.1 DUF4044 domain-containing protein [Bombilactobacillus mellifer]MCT6843366.1 DUF4044 domain-containing protein [Bombilactobacillus mellifer]MCT6893830.1 DUF4044 domain-containing protein [Bombilactobacillus mellifer]